jgi:holin-like protein
MKIFNKALIFFVICFVSDIISLYLPFPFPGSVLAMVILFLLLFFGAVKVPQVEPVSDFLLKNMALVFVPATVSIVSYADVLKSILWQFLIICIATTVITFVCTAYAVKLTVYFMNKRKEKKNNV